MQETPATEVLAVYHRDCPELQELRDNFPNVRFVKSDASTVTGVRNAGLAEASTRYLVYLDGDDLLYPNALSSGLAAFRHFPGAGMVYGGHDRLNMRTGKRTSLRLRPLGDDPFADFLKRNPVTMHGAVVYDRGKLLEIGGFDESLEMAEDHDVFLRMSQRYPIGVHGALVATYRRHTSNKSRNLVRMLQAQHIVLAKYRPEPGEVAALRRWEAAGRSWDLQYAQAVWRGEAGSLRSSLAQLAAIFSMAPGAAIRGLLAHLAVTLTPDPVLDMLRKKRRDARGVKTY